MYPNVPGARFDMNYFKKQHIPLIEAKLGNSFKYMALEEGIAGFPGNTPIYSVCLHIFSESLNAFMQGFGPSVDALEADVPNFTDIRSLVQFSEILIANTEETQ